MDKDISEMDGYFTSPPKRHLNVANTAPTRIELGAGGASTNFSTARPGVNLTPTLFGVDLFTLELGNWSRSVAVAWTA